MKFNLKNKGALSLLLAITLAFAVFSLSSCEKEPLVIKDTDTFVVIYTKDNVDDNAYLVDYMTELKENGELEFSLENKMVVSVNGIDNASDYSKCWMLYTSDAENANSAWGTVEYEGKEYGSAVLGAEHLKIKPNRLYVWVYMSFN